MQSETEPNFSYRYFEAIRRANTIANLGHVAVKSSELDELAGYEKRQYDEMHSALVEGLKGRVSTHYSFKLEGGRLIAEDGEDIEKLLVRGVEDAENMAASDNFFAEFLPQRARAELQEHRENLTMAKGMANFNTIVTLSPYSEEFDTSEANRKKLVQAAQKPYWQRAMLRVSHWDGEELHIFTRSIDNSDLEILKATASQSLDYSYAADNTNEMLAERIHMNIDDPTWELLPDMIVHQADKLISKRLDLECSQGRPLDDAANLEVFVSNHDEVLQHLLRTGRSMSLQHDNFETYKKAFDREVYNHLALLEARLEQKETDSIEDVGVAAGAAGAHAAAEGRVYDMCGMVLGANNASQNPASQTGFESLMRLEGKKITCPECKNKVVVPKKNLEAGVLTCSDCGYGVDICTGKKLGKSKPTQKVMRRPDFFEILQADLKRYTQQSKMKKSEQVVEKEPTKAWLW